MEELLREKIALLYYEFSLDKYEIQAYLEEVYFIELAIDDIEKIIESI